MNGALMRQFTKYKEGLAYFTKMSVEYKIKEAKKVIKIYNELLENSGEFLAAKFILDVYKNLDEELDRKVK